LSRSASLFCGGADGGAAGFAAGAAAEEAAAFAGGVVADGVAADGVAVGDAEGCVVDAGGAWANVSASPANIMRIAHRQDVFIRKSVYTELESHRGFITLSAAIAHLCQSAGHDRQFGDLTSAR
jgi:hypothetical protein